MRTIPATMASQHPDNAAIPYWHDKALISAQKEIKELYLAFSELGVSEFMWDWEGKLVDEAVIDRLYTKYSEYFLEHPIGRDTFITFRLPNPRVETEFRLGRAFMVMLAAAGVAKQIGLAQSPLFEVIIPMTETAKEMIDVEEAFAEMASLKHPLFEMEKVPLKHIEVLPLFEQVGTIIQSDDILREYLKEHKKSFGALPEYLRPFVARSDPALNAGILPTVLAITIALSRYSKLEKETGVALYPVIGCACLPFRGGLTPTSVEAFVAEYPGIRTVTIQSAFRYDYPKEEVIQAIKQLEQLLPATRAHLISVEEESALIALLPKFEKPYRTTIEALAPQISYVATLLPKRRERVQHVGLFGYSRGMGEVKLPRAIGFTGSLYSLGIPPELIGTGRGLASLSIEEQELVRKHYLGVSYDLIKAGRFVNKELIIRRAKTSEEWRGIVEDIKGIEQFVGEELAPQTIEEKEHVQLAEIMDKKLETKEDSSANLLQMALLRKSLG